VAFSAERGVYRVLLGRFSSRAEADAFVARLAAAGEEGFPVAGAPVTSGSVAVAITGEDGTTHRLPSPVDLAPAASDARVEIDAVRYRGSLRAFVNGRGTLNLVNLVDLEEYLYGVVPAEMGPRRFNEIEALKAQAVAARTYALAHRGQFEAEGYDLCATPKCQVYAGRDAEDPLSSAAVDATRGMVLAHEGRFADALFVSTCGGRTENVENVFGETPVPYLVSVECAELPMEIVPGARLDRSSGGGLSALAWRGIVLKRQSPRRAAVRGAALETAMSWAGIPGKASAPSTLEPGVVYPSLLAAFDLDEARDVHLLSRDKAYYAERPSATEKLPPRARDAYDFLYRFRLGAGEPLPPPDRTLTEDQYAGLLFSAALRLGGVTELAGRFLSREGSHLWVKTTEGRTGVPIDPETPFARKTGEEYRLAGELILRPGDRVRWWRRGTKVLALWVEQEVAAVEFERESAWTEWMRRVTGRELARRMAGRVAGTEVREIHVRRRSPAGRAVEMEVVTDKASIVLRRFELRQAVEMPEMLFTVQKVTGADGEIEFLFLGRGWGHGVGLCQNGAYGMAMAGKTWYEILRHYYTGADLLAWSDVAAGPPSTR
jgi:stage II sporulation protein D